LVFVAGCSTGHPVSPQFQPEPPEYIGRSCIAKLRPDGTPDFSNGCTASDRLTFEHRLDH
jgi:hypothetical protein